jgi:hypothetical protein
MDWEIRGLTGSEIYNIHADFKDEKALAAALRNPLWIFKSVDLFRRFPQEAFSTIQDYPADYLRRWDQLCQKAPHTGVAGNDSHQNVGLVVRLAEGEKARLEDALGEHLIDIPLGAVPALKDARQGKKPGDVLFRVQLDPYEFSLRHVGTHLLMTEFTEKGVWEALQAGRAFVAFDWLADATGFDLAAAAPTRRYQMGERLDLCQGLKLQGRAPLSGRWRVLRNGKLHSESVGRSLDYAIDQPGNFRVEVWLKVAGDDMPWILSNPFYIH